MCGLNSLDQNSVPSFAWNPLAMCGLDAVIALGASVSQLWRKAKLLLKDFSHPPIWRSLLQTPPVWPAQGVPSRNVQEQLPQQGPCSPCTAARAKHILSLSV